MPWLSLQRALNQKLNRGGHAGGCKHGRTGKREGTWENWEGNMACHVCGVGGGGVCDAKNHNKMPCHSFASQFAKHFANTIRCAFILPHTPLHKRDNYRMRLLMKTETRPRSQPGQNEPWARSKSESASWIAKNSDLLLIQLVKQKIRMIGSFQKPQTMWTSPSSNSFTQIVPLLLGGSLLLPGKVFAKNLGQLACNSIGLATGTENKDPTT